MCEEFIDNQLSLIQLERQAEIDEEKKIKSSSSLRQLQKSGVALTRLVVTERKTGLLGRTMVYLRPIGSSDELPNSNFSNGQIVAIYQTNDITADPGATGSLSRRSVGRIIIEAVERSVDPQTKECNIIKFLATLQQSSSEMERLGTESLINLALSAVQ
ncbi:hypothetical protein QYM36_006105 [Artemia franciscana]|uniref:Helicase SMUBP-2/HCS1 1B domain-containing protein n=1 Tax=Artemia franciscana TaxID=6661 RepID=A0AA88HVS7_ARTSF|nr:hypothetical protein QYM36_006105 [Artemia franciscana]